MALNFLKHVSTIEELRGDFCGLDNYQKLPNDEFSHAVIFADESSEYCIIGGTYIENNVRYCGFGIGKWNDSKNSYIVGDETLERIPLVRVGNDNAIIVKGKCKEIRNTLWSYNEKQLAKFKDVRDLLNKLYKSALDLDCCDYLLSGSRFKSLFPIPYTVNDEGFYYQEGTIFDCQGFTDLTDKNGNIVRKIKLVHKASEIFIDSTLFWYAFRMVDKKGDTINVFAPTP